MFNWKKLWNKKINKVIIITLGVCVIAYFLSLIIRFFENVVLLGIIAIAIEVAFKCFSKPEPNIIKEFMPQNTSVKQNRLEEREENTERITRFSVGVLSLMVAFIIIYTLIKNLF